MRLAAMAVSLLVGLAPLGLAQEGGNASESHSSSGSGSAAPSPTHGTCRGHSGDPREECQREEGICGETPEACRPSSNETSGEDPVAEDDQHSDGYQDCRADNASADQDCVSWVQAAEEGRREWISFAIDVGNVSLTDYTIAGLVALDALHLGLDRTNLRIEHEGATLRVLGGDAELRLHDVANGLMRFKGESGSVTLDFPAGAAIERSESGARMAYPGGREGHLLADEATWLDEDKVHLKGFFRYHVSAEATTPTDHRPAAAEETDERKDEAIEDRRVGAEVHLRSRLANAAALAADNESVQILAYDDVDVEVELPDEQATPDAPVRVVVSSELAEGRTIVLNLDGDLLRSTDAEDLLLRYFDLYNQSDGSVLETEVLFRRAASLTDVLEPSDDGGQPEHWVVEDANGVQILVSVPYWSVHAITVASLPQVPDAPSVLLGVSIGALATLALAMALFRPRRGEEL